MKWVSTRGSSPPISFIDALFAGTAPDGGLYMPERLDPLPAGTVDRLAGADVVTIGTTIGAHLLRDEITEPAMRALVSDALGFPIPLVQVTERTWVLELFHGPTLAFKDVGARVQARLLHHFTDGTPLTILVATSGDTGRPSTASRTPVSSSCIRKGRSATCRRRRWRRSATTSRRSPFRGRSTTVSRSSSERLPTTTCAVTSG
jgi:threonine synthase